MLCPFTLIVHLRVLRGVGVEWDEHSFLGRESESIYLDKVDHPVHSFLGAGIAQWLEHRTRE